MHCPVVVLVALVASMAIDTQSKTLGPFVLPFGSYYFDVEAMVNDKKIVEQEITCLLEERRCSPVVSKIIKHELKRALFFDCTDCSPVAKEAFAIIKPIIESKYPNELKQVLAKYAHLNTTAADTQHAG